MNIRVRRLLLVVAAFLILFTPIPVFHTLFSTALYFIAACAWGGVVWWYVFPALAERW